MFLDGSPFFLLGQEKGIMSQSRNLLYYFDVPSFLIMKISNGKTRHINTVMTCCEIGPCQLGGIEKFIQIPFLRDRFKTIA